MWYNTCALNRGTIGADRIIRCHMFGMQDLTGTDGLMHVEGQIRGFVVGSGDLIGWFLIRRDAVFVRDQYSRSLYSSKE